MKVRGFTAVLIILGFLFCFANSGVAADNWKAKQDEMFTKIGLKPGDKIDTSNWEKVKDVLPFSIVDWVKKGDLPVVIGEFKFDASADDGWKKKSAANAGKYTIGPDGELFDAKTNEGPIYVDGEPFPNIDLNDPKAANKAIFNFEIKKARVGTWNARFAMNYISRNGYEKKVIGDYLVYYYFSRPDGQQPNPQGYMELSLFPIREPYDVQGLVQLNRKFPTNRADDVYAYIPAIRRVKKLSGANRSDPSVGSDFILDDSNGWCGKNTSMKWKLLEKKVVLVPMTTWGLEAPLKARKLANGAYEVEDGKEPPMEGWNDPDWKGAPWIPMNIKWAPREVYVLEALAKDPYYSYGKQIMYLDDQMGLAYKVIYNKAGEYWKTLFCIPIITDFGKGDAYQRNLGSAIAFYECIDDKTDHATSAPCYGHYQGDDYSTKFNDPDLVPNMYAPSQISTMSR